MDNCYMFNRYIIYTWVLLCDYVKLLNELTVHHHSMNFQRGGTHLAQLLKDSSPYKTAVVSRDLPATLAVTMVT